MSNTSNAKDRGYWLVKELAAEAGVTETRIRQLLLDEQLPGDKAGQTWLVPYSAGQRWLEDRR